jgi:hypothetical protein
MPAAVCMVVTGSVRMIVRVSMPVALGMAVIAVLCMAVVV